MGLARIDDGEHEELREFAAAHHVSQAQLLGALIRRLHHGRIDVAEAVEEARERDTQNRPRG